eukprot:m.167485 g.167485  ORF g.167485 m.167485 type:complete len:1116 (+) comp16638_c0_seq1:322-3669(+)
MASTALPPSSDLPAAPASEGNGHLASSEKTVDAKMKESSGTLPTVRPPSLSNAVNDTQPVDVVSLEENADDAMAVVQDTLTPVDDPSLATKSSNLSATNGIKTSSSSSSLPSQSVDSHRDQTNQANLAVPHLPTTTQASTPNSAETSSPPGGEEDPQQELSITGRPKRNATKRKVEPLQPTEQPRRGSKPGPKPGRKKAANKTDKGASSTRAPSQDPFMNAHVHLQNDVDSEVLRILEEYRELLLRTMTAENAAFGNAQYSKTDVKNALCAALGRSRDRVQQALRPQMQGSGRSATGARGPRNTFMVRYEQELHQACASNEVDKVREMIEIRRVAPTALRHDNATPLGIAAEAGAMDVVKYLLECGVDVNHATGVNKCTPLHHAAMNNDLPLIKLLIRHSADRHAADEDGVSPLEVNGLHMASWVVLNNTPGPKGLAGVTARKRRDEAIQRRKQSMLREQQRKDRVRDEAKQRRQANGRRSRPSTSPNPGSKWKDHQGLAPLGSTSDDHRGDDIRIVKPDLPPISTAVAQQQAIRGQPMLALPHGVNPATVQAALRQLQVLQQQQPANAGLQSYVMSLPTSNGQSVILTTNGIHVAFQTPVYTSAPAAATADPLLPRTPITIVNYPDGAYEKLQAWRQEVPELVRTSKVWVHSEMALSFTNETEFLIGNNVNDVLQLEDKKNVWNKHRSMFRYCCDKKERQHISDAHPDSKGAVPMSMTLVVRSEVLNLARTHLAYARNPTVRERIERLPIIRPGKFLLSCIRQKAVKNLQRKVDTFRQEKDSAERQQHVAALMNAATNALQNPDPSVLTNLPQAVVDKAQELHLDLAAAEVSGRTAVEIAKLLRGDHGHLHPRLNLGNTQLVQASLQMAYDHMAQQTKTPEEAVQVAIRYFLMGRTQTPLLGANTSQHMGSSTLHTPTAPGTNPGITPGYANHTSYSSNARTTAAEGIVSAVPLDIASAQHLIPSTTQVMKNLNTVASMTSGFQSSTTSSSTAGFGNGSNTTAPPQLALSPRRLHAAAVQREAGVAINITSNGHLVPADMDQSADQPASAGNRTDTGSELAPVLHSMPLSAAAAGLPIVKTLPLGQAVASTTETPPLLELSQEGQPDVKRSKVV